MSKRTREGPNLNLPQISRQMTNHAKESFRLHCNSRSNWRLIPQPWSWITRKNENRHEVITYIRSHDSALFELFSGRWIIERMGDNFRRQLEAARGSRIGGTSFVKHDQRRDRHKYQKLCIDVDAFSTKEERAGRINLRRFISEPIWRSFRTFVASIYYF